MRDLSIVSAALCAVPAAMLFTAGPARGDIIWDEAVSGDLSTDPMAPTPLVFGLGSNIITGTITGSGDIRDYITFTLAPGQFLAALNLLAWDDLPGQGLPPGPGNTGFNAINEGATSFIPDATTISNFLGANHVEAIFEGTDILPGIAAAPFGGSGFEIPLEAGTYSYLVQQTGPQLNGYSLEFVVVPGPGAGAAMLIGAGLAVGRRRRRN